MKRYAFVIDADRLAFVEVQEVGADGIVSDLGLVPTSEEMERLIKAHFNGDADAWPEAKRLLIERYESGG